MYKGDPSDIETFSNVVIFVIEYSVYIFFNYDMWQKVKMSFGSPLYLEKLCVISFFFPFGMK